MNRSRYGRSWPPISTVPEVGCSSPANMAIYLSVLGAQGRSLGMNLAAGGHLTHGAKPNFSGKTYHAVQYGLNAETGEVASLACALDRVEGPLLISYGDILFRDYILDLLFEAVEVHGSSLVAVTHDHELLGRFDRIIDFNDFRMADKK